MSADRSPPDYPNTFSYRAFPVPTGLLSAVQLRAGMDAMWPR